MNIFWKEALRKNGLAKEKIRFTYLWKEVKFIQTNAIFSYTLFVFNFHVTYMCVFQTAAGLAYLHDFRSV